MASPDLCAALVNSGALSVKQLTGLLARQTLHGGALDTLVLEQGLMAEGPLVRILAAISGYPPMRTAWTERVDPRAEQLLGRKTAEQLDCCPVTLEGSRLTVLVAHHTCPVALSEAAYEAGVEIVPLVTTGVRLAQLRSLVYRAPLSKRYAQLLARLGPIKPTLRRVVVGSESEPNIALPMLQPSPPRRPTRQTIRFPATPRSPRVTSPRSG